MACPLFLLRSPFGFLSIFLPCDPQSPAGLPVPVIPFCPDEMEQPGGLPLCPQSIPGTLTSGGRLIADWNKKKDSHKQYQYSQYDCEYDTYYL